MRKLDHPLKRLSFVFFVCCSTVFVALSLLPSPLHLSSFDDWKDSIGSESRDRQITRIDTACAAKASGGIEAFAKDFFIIDAQANENEYSRLITLNSIERGERFSIAPEVDLTDKEKTSFFSRLSILQKPCLRDTCVEWLNPSVFASILASCGISVGQHHHVRSNVEWRIGHNLEDSAPWSVIALTSAFIFLFTSLLYDKTIGPLVKWIRTGLW